MHSARVAIAGGMVHIEEQVKALELAVAQNAGLAFDLAKTLVESTCKTIITERGNQYNKDDDLPELFKIVTRSIPFLPVALAAEADARRSLEQTLNGLKTALQGMCELRNAFGFASHGSDRARPPMEEIQAILVAQAADTIIGFLYRVHRQDLLKPTVARLDYNDNRDFNEWLDEQCESVQILSLPSYRPSDVLFNVDQEAYRDLLAGYRTEDETEREQDEAAQERNVTE